MFKATTLLIPYYIYIQLLFLILGYNFCALAALFILGKQNMCNITAQERWLIRRQMRLEGGFQGRTNKLVDSCYSFWQGSATAIIKIIHSGGNDLYDMHMYMQSIEMNTIDIQIINSNSINRVTIANDTNGELPYNQKALQKYILHCGQNSTGGLRDKPGKSRDYYHR